MATRRRTNTVEALRPEQEEERSSRQPSSSVQTDTSAKSNGSGQEAAETRPNGPVPVEPMSQSRNAGDLENRIRQRAYELYEARGRQDGRADEDWLLAEEEVTGITGGGD